MTLLKLLATAAVGVALFLASSESARALSLSLQATPPAITAINQTIVIDLNVSGVKGTVDGGGTLRGYDIVINFDPSVLSLTSGDITLNLVPFGGSIPPVQVLGSSVSGGNASLGIFVSVVDVNNVALRAIQTDAFQLAQLSFTTVRIPVQTAISFGTNDLTGLDAFEDTSSATRTHSSTGLVLVPEPGVATLVALGFAGLTASRRRRAR